MNMDFHFVGTVEIKGKHKSIMYHIALCVTKASCGKDKS